ncbi:porin [Hyphomicrobium sp.]|uniref:porin n=1 Tax=Hyphomicrobium sp. TaxID=82 RepID=UPI000F92CEA7|nr:porin [Hyphomicrobium sp.]RUP08845.1 MAG: porin [Hyphomicrobium sp.]
MTGNTKIKIRGLSSLRAAALVACASVFSYSAQAADLGGNCCADLEERIAELEATAAHKGNRKVSLTISGWVTEQVMGWSDGVSTNAFVGTSLNDLGNRLHFDGSAKINSEWSAGYSLRLDVVGANGFIQDAHHPDGGEGPPDTLNSYWWIKSERWGRVSVGRQSQATDDVWVDVSGAGSIFAANLVDFDGQNFQLVPEGTKTRAKARWGDLATCYTTGVGIFADCGGDRTNNIRYDTPTLGGFMFSTSYGEAYYYDFALRHNYDGPTWTTAFGVGFQRNHAARINVITPDYFGQVSFAALHKPTGLFGSVYYGHESPEGGYKDTDELYLKAGIRAKLNPLGATVFYGEYGRDNDLFSGLLGGAVFSGVTDVCDGFAGTGGKIDNACSTSTSVKATGSTFDRFGFGVVQELDAASAAFWLKYKNYGADVDFVADGVRGNEDMRHLHIFALGGAVFF